MRGSLARQQMSLPGRPLHELSRDQKSHLPHEAWRERRTPVGTRDTRSTPNSFTHSGNENSRASPRRGVSVPLRAREHRKTVQPPTVTLIKGLWTLPTETLHSQRRDRRDRQGRETCAVDATDRMPATLVGTSPELLPDSSYWPVFSPHDTLTQAKTLAHGPSDPAATRTWACRDNASPLGVSPDHDPDRLRVEPLTERSEGSARVPGGRGDALYPAIKNRAVGYCARQAQHAMSHDLGLGPVCRKNTSIWGPRSPTQCLLEPRTNAQICLLNSGRYGSHEPDAPTVRHTELDQKLQDW
mmetsp:Transcript_51151/g.136292  ORF Transcript_51151/g.136292 Transcript_51151/m.136292 type:complete len:299 (-) Transcript_51151:1837-2733(-)